MNPFFTLKACFALFALPFFSCLAILTSKNVSNLILAGMFNGSLTDMVELFNNCANIICYAEIILLATMLSFYVHHFIKGVLKDKSKTSGRNLISLLHRNISISRPVWVVAILMTIFSLNANGQTVNETLNSGAFIINMGVTPQTIANGLKPYGLVYALVKNQAVPVKWVIDPNKIKDGKDFTYNGVDYKGGTFIVPAEYRTTAVNTLITTWTGMGVAGVTTTSAITVPVFTTLKAMPVWTMDLNNGDIAIDYLTNAGIPITAYNSLVPANLTCCNDIFVMPHADPTWPTHGNLMNWNLNCKGAIWLACHAGSATHDLFNPADTSQQMNFLATRASSGSLFSPGGNPNPGNIYRENTLLNWNVHNDGTPPYTYAYPADPYMQFMGTMDAATQNGSEQIYLPKLSWNAGAKLYVTDPTQQDVPGLSPGAAAVVVAGKGFDNPNRGSVMMEAGHDHNATGNNAPPVIAKVAAQRIFLNFSFFTANEKAIIPEINLVTADTLYYGVGQSFTYDLPAGVDSTAYTTLWTSSCGGTFSPNATSKTVFYTPPAGTTQSNCLIKVKITDACGRVFENSRPLLLVCPLTVTKNITSPTCIGGSNGSIAMTISGGTAPYSWDWDRTSPPGTASGTGTTFSGLSAGSYEVTVSSSNGCFSIFTSVVSQSTDNVPPVFDNCPAALVLNCGDLPPSVPTVTATDAATGAATVVYNGETTNAPTCPTDKIYVRTWTATDGCGNSTQCVQSITYNPDNVAPTFDNCPLKLTLSCGTSLPAVVNPTATDACTGTTTVTYLGQMDNSPQTCPTSLIYLRTWRATDACNNSSTCVQSIVFTPDATGSTITGTIPETTLEGCSTGVATAAVTTVAGLEALGLNISDACTSDANLGVSSSDASSGTCPIVVTRTYTVTDVCGNSATITQVINVDDNTAPSITGTIAPTTVEGCTAGAATAAVTTVAGLEALGLTISDACTTDTNLGVSSSDASSGTCPIVVTRTYTVTDVCGNSATITQVINVDDNTAPSITGTIAPTTVEGCTAGAATAAVTTVAGLEALGLTISDACTTDANLGVSSSDASSGTCPIVVTRTYTVTDVCGNSATITQLINVDDNTAPSITGTIAPTTVEGCTAGAATAAVTTVAGLEALGLTISDACTTDANLGVSSSDASSGTCPIEVTRTYTITDVCGNSTTATQVINVDDNTAPSITGTIAPTTVEGCTAGAATAAVTTVAGLEALGLTISDACTTDANLGVSSSDASTGTCPIVVTRTYTVTDVCGNSTTATQVINVDDNTAPSITGTIAPTTVEGCTAGAATAAVTTVAGLEALGLTISDACTTDANLGVSSSDASSGTCPIVVTRTYTITDVCGNSTTATQVINVDDNTAPSITGTIAPTTVEGCTAGAATAAVTTVAGLEALGLTISDACTTDANLGVSSSDASSGTCPIVVTRTYTITDVCGNSTTATQVINVDDNTAPSITGTIAPTTVEGCTAGAATAAVTTVAGLEALGLTISDACTTDANLGVSSSDASSGTCPMVVTRTYTITDVCGNSTTATQVINVDDNTAPSITGTIAPTTVEGCTAGAATAAVTTVAGLEALGLTISDACTTDANLGVSSSDASTGTCPIVVTRTYTVTDVCGNSATITQVINVDDNTATSITGTIAPTTVEGCTAGAATAAVTTVAGLEALGLTISDACTTDANLGVSSSDASTGTCPIVVTRTYTVTDVCGNSATITQVINVDDNTAPSITGTIAPTTVEGCTAGAATAAVTTVAGLEALGLTISDACTTDANLGVSSSDASSGTCPIEVTRTYTITDVCGNSTTATQVINVDDNTAPSITGTIAPTTVEGCTAGAATAAVTTVAGLEALGLTISDACTTDANLGVSSSDASTGTCPIVVTRTYTVTDVCGNSATITQVINVDDNTATSITGTIAPTTVEGCTAGAATAAVTTVAGLEALGLTISDACTTDANLGVSSSDASTGTCPIVVTRTYTVTDVCGNSATITQVINVDDNTAPSITGTIAPTTVEGCTAGAATAAVTTVAGLEALGLTISDACTTDANLGVSSSDASSGTCPIEVTRTYTITDVCGNSTTATQVINVDDNTAPSITGTIAPTTVEGCTAGAATAAVTTVAGLEALGLTISDACTTDANLGVSSSDASSGTCPIVVTRTYTVTDVCGNSATITQVINVDDNTAPSITGTIAPTTVEGCTAGAATAAVTTVAGLEALGLTISDACTTDANLGVSSSDASSGTCPIVVTRTYTVTDVCGNSATITQVINVDDNTVPSITGTIAPTTVEGCTAGAATAAVTTVAGLEALGLTISDACTTDANLGVSSSDASSGTCPIVVTRTYTVTDVCGNSATITQVINVDDNTAPSITGTIAPTTVEGCTAGAATAAVTTVAGLEALGLTISDACTTDANLGVSSSDASTGTCPMVVTRTYTVTDVCGNSATITQVINVDDNTAPSITGTIAPTTVEGCTAGAATAAVTTVAGLEALGLTISDACTTDANLGVSSSDASSGTCPIVVTRTYTVTDVCGNSATITQVINVDDNTAPTITGTIAPTTVEGCTAGAATAAVTTVAGLEALGLTISDACTTDANLGVSSSDASTGTCPIEVTRTYTITDVCGNSTTATQVINVDDNTAPSITGTIAPTTVEGCTAGAATAAVTTVAGLEALGLTISDACTTDANLGVSSSDASSGTCPIVVTRTYTVTDVCGNLATITQVINVDDNTAPSITGTIAPTTVEGCTAGAATAAVTTVAGLEALGLTISDACTTDANLGVSSSDASSGTCPIVVTRTYTVTDVCGNSATITQVINVDDNTAPSITGTIAPTTVEGCTAGAATAAVTTVAGLEALGLTISDACTTDANLGVSSSDASTGTCPIVVTRTYTVTDVCGNSATITQVINVDDNTAPSITGTIAPTTVEGCTAGAATAAVTTVAGLEALGLTISDACTTDANLGVSSSDASSGTCPMVVTRTYTVTDVCGNSATITQVINVDDNTAPSITGTIAPTTVEGCTAGAATAAVTTVAGLEALGLTISDACTTDANLGVSSSDASSGTCPIVVTRTYTVTDVCGNSATITQVINVDDNTAPSITGTIAPTTVEGCTAGAATAAVTTVAGLEALGLTISDACTTDANLGVSSSDASSGTCPMVVTRTYTVTDVCGNSTTITQVINVDDNTAPSITGTLAPTTVEGCTAGAATAAVTTVAGLEALGLTISDACTTDANLGVSSSDASSGTCPMVVTRTYTVTDVCGNSTTITQVINVDDNTAPTINDCPTDQILSCGATLPLVIDPTATDACTSIPTVSYNGQTDNLPQTCPSNEVYIRSWTATDICGNTAQCIQSISFGSDNGLPSFTNCPANIALNCGTTLPTVVDPTATDACTGSAAVDYNGQSDNLPQTCPTNVVYVRSWTATDACGNTAQCVQSISYNSDNSSPSFTKCPASTILNCNDVIPPPGVTLAIDACSGNSAIVYNGETNNIPQTCPTDIIYVRTWTATDACGNTALCVQSISYNPDVTNPVFTNCPADLVLNFGATLPVVVDPGATDECTGTPAVVFDGETSTIPQNCPSDAWYVRTWTATDACGNSTQCIQSITFEGAPVANRDDEMTTEEVPVTFDPLVNDTDGDCNIDPTTVMITDQPENGSVNVDPVTGMLTYTPDPGFYGQDTLVYNVCDSGSPILCDTALVVITVNPVNDPPIANLNTATTNEDTPVTFGIVGNDTDSDGNINPTTVTITDLPNNGMVSEDPVTGALTYIPNAGFNGIDTLVYQVCDDGTPLPAQCDTAIVFITVNAVNDPPIANLNTATTNEDTPVTFGIVGNDTDSDGNINPTTVTITDLPNNGMVSVDPVTGALTYIPNAGFNGIDTLVYQVCDDGTPLPALCDTALVVITVGPVNDPPIADPDPSNTDEDTPVDILVVNNDTDVDGNIVPTTVVITDPPNNGTASVDPVTGVITYTPNPDFNGQDTLVYIVCDDGTPLPALCDTALVVITVGPVNDPPIADPDPSNTDEDTPVDILVVNNDTDVDGNIVPTTVVITDPPNNGTASVDPVTGVITYTPNPDFNGQDTLVYIVCDDGTPLPALCDTALVVITVEPVNDPPIADPDPSNTDEDTPVDILVVNNDTDVDGNIVPTTVVITDPPNNGTASVDPVTGVITYTPNPDFNGQDTLVYIVCDDGTPLPALCDTALVVITVGPVNDPPIADPDPSNTDEDTPVDILVVNNDTDVDGNIVPTTVVITDPPNNGTASVDPVTGVITYTPNPDFNGQDTLVYIVCDDGTPLPALCDTALVVITVGPVNDPPIADPDPSNTDEDTPVDILVVNNDTDVDGNIVPTTVVITDPPNNGTASVDPVTGVITYTPNPDFNGQDTLVYIVCDDGTPLPALCDTALVVITINPVNDPPIANMNTATTNEDTSVPIGVVGNDTDSDGNINPASVTITDQPNNGTVTVNPITGVITYTPNPGFNGQDTLVYNICDDGTPLPVQCDTALVVITVIPLNDPPVAIINTVNTNEDTPVSIFILGNDTDSDGNIDPTTVTITDQPNNGMVTVDPLTGVITYTPNNGFTGRDTLIYNVCDDGFPAPPLCDTALVVIIVKSQNDPPIANMDVASTNEDTAVPIGVVGNDTDSDGNINPATVTITDQPNHGSASVNPVTGVITYTPGSGYNGQDTLVYQVCDDGTPTPIQCDTALVVITIIPVNDPPIANMNTATTNEDTSVLIGVVGNDTDSDGNINPTSVTITDQPNNGIVTVDPVTGVITYTPNPDFNGQDTLVYQVCDDGTPLPALCDTALVVITVGPVNDPPIADPDPASTDEDTPVDILVVNNDTDSDGNIVPTTVVITDPPNNGTSTVDPVTGVITYTPDPDFNGLDTLVYQVCDDGTPLPALCDTALVVITVGPVNDPPIADPDPSNTDEDTPVDILVVNNDTDVDGNIVPTTVVITDPPNNGTASVDPVTGVITYTPNPDFNGQDTLVYIVCDDGTPLPALCDTALVVITINPVNDPPIANMNTATTNEDTSVPIGVVGNDTDSDGNINPASVTITDQPNNGTVTVNPITGVITYTPNPGFNGQDTLVYNICDDGTPLPVQCDTALVVITVIPLNDPPVAIINTVNTNEDTPVSIIILGNDTDSDGNIDPTTVTITDQPNNGMVTVDPLTGVITYTPNAGFTGRDTLIYNVCDDGFPAPPLCDTALVVIIVKSQNDPPIANMDVASTNEDTAVPIGVVGNDTDSDGNINPATVIITDQPNHGSANVNPVTGVITYTPDPGYNGQDTLVYQVCDDGTPTPIQCDTALVVITIIPVNDPPIANMNTATTSEDTWVPIGVVGNDTDSDGNINPTTVTITDQPNNGTVTVDPVTGVITYTPNPDFNGQDTLVYQVCDDGTPLPALCDTALVVITVNPVNDPPIADPDPASTDEDTPVDILVVNNDTDSDGNINPTTVTITDQPNNGTVIVDPVTGVITYTPNPDFNGQDTLVYQVCDDGTPLPALCDTALVVITVGPVNDPPIADLDPANTDEDTPVDILVVNNDTDIDGNIDPTTVVITDQPDHGTATVDPVTGVITYIPNPDFNGQDTLVYSVCDDGTPLPALCDTALVVITVGPVNDPPIADPDPTTTNEDTPVDINVVGNDTDIDGDIDPTSVVITEQPNHGTVTVDPITGVITYIPDPDYNGQDTLVYSVCDDGTPLPALCDTALVVITVNPVNDPPNAVRDDEMVFEDDSVTFDPLVNDTDIDGNIVPTTVVITDTPDHGTATVDPITGAITYTPDPNYNGQDTLVYIVCDDGSPLPSQCDTALVVITVIPVTDLPNAIFNTAITDEDTGVNIDVLDNDNFGNDGPSDGAISITDNANHGTAVVDDNSTPDDPTDDSIDYTPAQDYYGLDTLIYEICDASGDCDTAVVFILINFVSDGPPAFINCPVDTVLSCGANLPPVIDPLATDNCTGIHTVVYNGQTDNLPQTCPTDVVYIRTWTVTDQCGDAAQCIQTISFSHDNVIPVFSNCPTNTVLNCGDGLPVVPNVLATDQCTGTASVLYIGQTDNLPQTCPTERLYIRKWRATDACGNSAQCVQSISYNDDATIPSFTDCPANVVLNCGNALPVVASPTATDACSGTSTVVYNGQTNNLPQACPTNAVYIRSWTATDDCGNSSQCVQTITYNSDIILPTFDNCPANVVLNCGTNIPVVTNPTASDACSGSATVVYNGESNNLPQACPTNTIYVRRWTATDGCGNSTQCVQSITYNSDVTLPAFTSCPANTVLNCGATLPVVAIPAATDACSGTALITYNGQTNNLPQACPTNTVYVRRWTATDACGNSAQCVQSITYNSDVTLPVFNNCPANTVLNCGATLPSVATPTANDACSGSSAVVYNGQSDNLPQTCPTNDIYVRSWTATDGCGNSTQCVQSITYNSDTAVPSFNNCPANAVLNCGESLPGIINITATDACSGTSSVVYNGQTDNLPQTCPSNEVYVRSWTATDACGNSAQCVQSITYQSDSFGPTFNNCPQALVMTCADVMPLLENVTASDNCTGSAAVEYNGETNNLPQVCLGDIIYARTWTATDACGNTASCQQIITVEFAAPVLEDLPDMTISCTDPYPSNLPGAMTDCGGDLTITEDFDEVVMEGCPSSHIATRTFTATDCAGNVSITTQSIWSLDMNGPEFVFVPDDITVSCGQSYTVPDPIAIDDCWVCVIQYDDEVIPGSNGSDQTIIRTYEASDQCGHFIYTTMTITLIDDEAPVMNMGPDMQEGDTIVLSCTQMFMPNMLNVNDNCDNTVAVTQATGNITYATNCATDGYLRIEERIFTATDDMGNSSEFTIYVRWEDNAAPYFYQSPQNYTLPCNGNVDLNAVGDWLNSHGGAIAEDLCSEFTWLNNLDVSALVCDGTTTVPVTFTVTDACGNVNAATVNLTIQEGPATAFAPITGNIVYGVTEAPLKEVTLSLTGGTSNSDVTDALGNYSFASVPLFNSYGVSPERNFDPLNGVTTYDIVLIKKHILGITPFTSPYLLLASDANRSGSITALDLVQIRQLILWMIPAYPNNTSWRFVKGDYDFINPLNPFMEDIPEIGYIQNMLGNTNIDFKGIKVGDVNGNANPNANGEDENRNTNTLTLTTTDKLVKKGEMISLPVKVDRSEMAGVQFTLNYDHEKMRFEGMQRGALEVNETNYAVFEEQGAVTFSCDRAIDADDITDKELFYISFRALDDLRIRETLTLNSRFTSAKAYLQNGEEMDVALAFDNEGQISESDVFELYQNQPNPFKGTTSIGFNLPERSDITLKVFDSNGRMLKLVEKTLNRGYHEVFIDSKELTGNGVYYYQLNTGEFSATKSMIILE